MIALRAVSVYLLLFLVIRFSGKRAIGNFTAFDLLIALLLGEIVAEIIFADVTFLEGGAAILAVALIHQINAWATYFLPSLGALLEGSPTVLMKNGEFQLKGMRKEHMNKRDVLEELRLSGVDDPNEVELLIMENNGEVSVIRHEWARNVQRCDLPIRSARKYN